MKKLIILIILSISLFFFNCKGEEQKAEKQEVKLEAIDPKDDIGIGPIQSIQIGETIDKAMADKGAEIFNTKCKSCHKLDKRLVGPAVKGVTTRRRPEWIMNMILNPIEMIQKNATANALFKEHNNAPMAQQNLTEQETRSVLEYFRQIDSK